ncbi:50S ribosomal protein L4 [Candidatus Gottesmanbacteria bacterium RIFCSPLOWO2_01_FULL_43_11b]|uniref:Large ribosomal subunit protein uL4 n=1 Tax=Candidatus Gottesmanbacteria bacterium RIFCSPLOWO2_01_FULL_43_11b TaxID=1798392 RepID=A0A1F6AJ63_9BACT|nr:MAG: 50S ribosomal protein L4 [Candidatus Gottesmanbacteria bacterium RIFCSPLOWO2_01_FULL_43_11b]
MGTDGKSSGKVTLPSQLFAVKVNKELLVQSIRVYEANQRAGAASTKTRGEVEGSTRKIYRQKGSGRARHGSIRAPIFVGGGIVFGPKPRDYSLHLPKKMKSMALASALTTRYQDGSIHIVDGLDKLKPKTKLMAKTLKTLGIPSPVLLVTSKEQNTVIQGARNISGVTHIFVNQLHPYAIFAPKSLLFTKQAILSLKDKP